MQKRKIAVIFGTRPDTIKMAPIIKELERETSFFDVINIATAQHRQMLDQVLDVFKIKPNYDLNLMASRQTLADLTSRTLLALDQVLEAEKPDMVLVQGDTATTFIGSLAAFYRKIPIGHVEAGLRTNDKYNPFPEEINRRLTSCMADIHFAPTATAKHSLVIENQNPNTIFITGNSVIDALEYGVDKNHVFGVEVLNKIVKQEKKIILVTMHRRENWGEPMVGACQSIKQLALEYPNLNFIFPLHLNPVVRDVVQPILEGLPNVSLIEPLIYLDFVNIMSKAFLILTDSGGVQEEGPHFGIPILVLRTVTERPEAVDYGTVKLTGMDGEKIYENAKMLIDDKIAYQSMANAVNPYGDGLASKRTVQAIKQYFNQIQERPTDFIPSKK
jgi:UDP-N-acetylglucosamine 2-epimerase (non-hydrolysing)